MTQRRKHYGGEEKVSILRRHLLEDVPVSDLCDDLGLAPGKFYDWKNRYGKVNKHNGGIPRDFWLLNWEKQAIVDVKASA